MARKRNRDRDSGRGGSDDSNGAATRAEKAVGRQSLSEAASEALHDLKEAKLAAVRGADRQRVIAELDEDSRSLVLTEDVPLWAVRVHARIGHLGGFGLFLALMLAAWSIAGMVAWGLLEVVAGELVTKTPAAVLSSLGVSVEVAVSTTDRFVFTWLVPVLFMVAVLAGVCVKLISAGARWGLGMTLRLAKGLFAGYGTSVFTDVARLRAGRVGRKQRRASKKAARARRRESVLASRRAVAAAEDDAKATAE